MKISRDFSDVPERKEVLLFCIAGAGREVACLAWLQWITDSANSLTEERTLAWRSTWDGSPLPAEWKPYAWATFDAPDPAADEAPLGEVL